ncbi:hypothetical protein SLS60_007158 [Paraconiothyrium brasiliense]|uniref:Uncharacterized protein n=1 Tax=Paraconiothyrium brasiliense TaxID=300254 RepID=A0ABR3R8K9_9PLEO
MPNQKRKAHYDIGGHEDKRARQTQPNAYRQNHVGKHANKRGGRPFVHPRSYTQAQIQQYPNQIDQTQVAPTLQQMQQMQRMFTFLAQHGQLPFPQQQQQPQFDKGMAQQHIPQPSDCKPASFAPYSEFTIPILWSTKIDHSFSPTLHQEQWDATAWANYYSTVTMLKAGITRQQFGLPEAKEGYGKGVTIDYTDLYLNLNDGKVYVAASDRGLMTVPDYLKLCGIAWERKLRFTGKTPEWAKTVFAAAETRYVTKEFKELPLRVHSVVLVLQEFPVLAPRTPAGIWGLVYSTDLKKVVQFPLVYTSEDREFAIQKEGFGSLSAVEVKHVFCFPPKNPSPQELGEALFKQSEECDAGNLDLQMSKSRDDYLQECGHLYGKYSLANTQEKKGIFFNPPPSVPFDEHEDKFVVYEARKGKKETYYVDWNRARRGPTFLMNGMYFKKVDTTKTEVDLEPSAEPRDKAQQGTLKDKIPISKPVETPTEKAISLTMHSEGVEVDQNDEITEKRADATLSSKEASSRQEVQALDSASLSASADLTQNGVEATLETISHDIVSKASEEERVRRLQELRQKLVANRAEKLLQKSDAVSEDDNTKSTIIEASNEVRKRKRSDSLEPPIKRVKTEANVAPTESSATSPTIAVPEDGALEEPKAVFEDNDGVNDDSAIDLSLDPAAGTAVDTTIEPLIPPGRDDGSVKSAPVEDICGGGSADIDDSGIDLELDTPKQDDPVLAPVEVQPQLATEPDRAHYVSTYSSYYEDAIGQEDGQL